MITMRSSLIRGWVQQNQRIEQDDTTSVSSFILHIVHNEGLREKAMQARGVNNFSRMKRRTKKVLGSAHLLVRTSLALEDS